MEKTHAYVPGAEFPWQYKYEHMAVTTDCVIFTYADRELKVLLIRRGGEPCKGMWAFPGGFLRNSEDAMEGALRELREETDLTPSSPIVQFGVFSNPDRDPRERVITIAWYALVRPSEVHGGDDADEAAWFPVDNLPPLAFDHEEIFHEAMERLRRDIHFQPVGFDLLDDRFSLPDLQSLYETILGVQFDRRNFQRKILSSGILDAAEPAREEKMTYGMAEIMPPMAECDMVYDDDISYASYYAAPPENKRLFEAAPPKNKRFSEAAPRKKGRPGRTAFLFRFNREKYDEMKEDGMKQEF